MGYLHIDNLYKNQEILMFKECYALEKIHGTSAHISCKDKQMKFFSGGEDYRNFVALFREGELHEKMKHIYDVIVYGEAYGGKCQGMRDTYGDQLKFVAFDVKIDGCWLAVPQAESFVKELDLEFVHYAKISTNMDEVDRMRDMHSVQAIRNGCGEGKQREGVILRPLIEVTKNNGARIIAKHKGEKFRETSTPRKVSPEKLKVLEDAKAIAQEWVTYQRLSNILSHRKEKLDMSQIGELIKIMVDDIYREAKGEIIKSKEVTKAISKKTAELIKAKCCSTLYE